MLKLKNVYKKYDEMSILNDISLDINQGEFVAITGKSGTGKTTLLNIMGMIIFPDQGDVILSDCVNPKGNQIRRLRQTKIGYLFQNYFLIDDETVEYNMRLPLYKKEYSKSKAIQVLESLNLDPGILGKKIYQLSGGEQQRIALARAILKDFDILLADEPTGNLDQFNKDIVLTTLKRIKQSGKTVVCVTHDHEIASAADRIIAL